MEINVIPLEAFEKWLVTLGYSRSTVQGSGGYLGDFFFYLKTRGARELEEVNPGVLDDYYRYIQQRGSKRREGGLSDSSMSCCFNALRRFSRYLQETGGPFFEVPVRVKVEKQPTRPILTREEVRALYKACGSDYLGSRDRAMLSLYYGLGLRRHEGVSLDTRDVSIKDKLVLVREGKGHRERHVPMTGAVRDDLEQYLYQGREQIRSFRGGVNPGAFLLSRQGGRVCGNQVIERVHGLASLAGINKVVGLHTLRHSIATHLLQSGLTLEEVSRFLGHCSLESTQIYTHLAHEC